MVKHSKTIRLFGKTITVNEKPKIFKLFGVKIPVPEDMRNIRRYSREDMYSIRFASPSDPRIKPLVSAYGLLSEPPTPPSSLLPSRIMCAIQSLGGSAPILLAKKKLEESDVKGRLSRFFVPNSQALLDALTQEEREIIEGPGIGVTVYDPRGIKYEMCFKKWASLNQLVLIKQWMKLVRANELQKNDSVELWGFRVNEKLNFFLDRERGTENFHGGDGASTSGHAHA